MANHLKKIGLLGGTFNPIHVGHLNLACELREKGGLDEIWFIPTALSPFKQKEKMVPAFLRYRMVEIALHNVPEFRLIDYESKQVSVCYTIDTLRFLLSQNHESKFFLCLAEDSLDTFHLWKEYRAILALVPLLVGSRFYFDKKKIIPFLEESCDIQIIQTTLFEVSASEIRARLRKRLFCDHLVPQKVLDFIYENQLYFDE